jgi:hypothetical protein
MRTMAVLLVLVVAVVGLAAHGSGASPVSASSAAFAQCFGDGDAAACRPLRLRTLADVPEGREYGELSSDAGWSFGGSAAGEDPDRTIRDQPAPEFWRELAMAVVRAGLNYVAGEAVRYALDRLFGGGHRLPIVPDEQVASHAFDPVW